MSGILSAYGIALADIVEEVQEACAVNLEPSAYAELEARLQVRAVPCMRWLVRGVDDVQAQHV